MKTILVILAALTLTGTAQAARTVHLYGDSILKGWGYGHYDDPSFLGRPDLIAITLARANGSQVVFNRTTVQSPDDICAAVANSTVGPKDRILFENAGPHWGTSAPYQAWLEDVVRCSLPASRLTFTTMFDYQPLYPLSTYDEPMDDGRSVNTITRDVAWKAGARLIDWNAEMDKAVAALPQLRLVHPDGIHPTALGNIVLGASLARGEGVKIVRYDAVVDELVRERARIVEAGWAPSFTREQANGWARTLVTGREPSGIFCYMSV